MRIPQTIKITFTGRQIDPGIRHATEHSPFPWGHAKEAFHYGARRIALFVHVQIALFERLLALGLLHGNITLIERVR